MYAIVTLPLVPLRQENNERSEMLSQLLFGECVQLLETQNNWLKVKNLSDDYIGWADRKMISPLNELEYRQLSENMHAFKVSQPLSRCIKQRSKQSLLLPAGALLWMDESNQCIINGEKYEYDPAEICDLNLQTGEQVLHYAHQFLNTPYLWGGKSLMGIDCSGLVQVVFSIIGIQLPRDASQQVEKGKIVDNIDSARAGDLAFFVNEKGRVSHVGILLNKQQIIHASGWVKIEQIDQSGIISAADGSYTHKLHEIKRIL